MPGPEPSRPPRPPRRPRPEPVRRSPTYKASVVLAIVFLGLALSLPLWLDRVRQPVDRGVLETELSSVPAIPGAGPRTFVPPAPPVSPTATPRGSAAALAAATGVAAGAVNADCRAYVYARCNALRIEPSDCLPIALDAMRVNPEAGMAACQAEVAPRLKAVAATVPGSLDEVPPTPDVLQSPDAQVPAPAGGAKPPVPAVPGAAKAGTGAAAAAGEAPALPPAQRAERLEKALILLEELQRGANNYATIPAAQDARMAEIRALVEAEGSPEAKTFYNNLVKRYQAPPPPEPGATVGESPRQETGYADGPAPASTEEMDQVRRLANEARREAGLPPQAPPDPADALRARSPSEAPAAQEYRP